MDRQDYQAGLEAILPERDEPNENYSDQNERASNLKEALDTKETKINAATLARIKYREKKELEKIEKRKLNPTYGMTDRQAKKYEEEQARITENIAEIEAIENAPEAQNFLAGGPSDLTPWSGTTKRDVVKLLTSLNINLSLNLTQSDTYNLLGCLLTCNEEQLEGLYMDKKVPLAIKTVIKRLMDDARLGNIETVEKLWDRIFGKNNKATLEVPAAHQVAVTDGIIPHTVVSREAYTIIRDVIIGKE